MCGAKKGGLSLDGVDVAKESVIQGQVLHGDEPVGNAYVLLLDGSPTNRELQTLRIPVTESNSAVLEVLATTSGPRNTTAVSEIRLGSAVE